MKILFTLIFLLGVGCQTGEKKPDPQEPQWLDCHDVLLMLDEENIKKRLMNCKIELEYACTRQYPDAPPHICTEAAEKTCRQEEDLVQAILRDAAIQAECVEPAETEEEMWHRTNSFGKVSRAGDRQRYV